MSDIEPVLNDEFSSVRKRCLYGIFISGFGSAMAGIAVFFTVYQQSKSLSQVALLSIFYCVPCLALAGAATHLVSRFKPYKIYISSRLTLTIVAFIPGILYFTGGLNVSEILIWYLIQGIVLGLATPTWSMIVSAMTPTEKLTEFNGQIAQASAYSALAGILFGGIFFGLIGPGWVYILNAISYLAVQIALRPVRKIDMSVKKKTRLSEWTQIKKQLPGLRAIIGYSAACFLFGSFTVVLPAVAALYGGNALLLSCLDIAAIIGGIIITWAIRNIIPRIKKIVVQRLCFATVGVGLILLALEIRMRGHSGISYLLVVLTLIPIGFALAVQGAVLSGITFVETPMELQTVVFTVKSLVPLIFVTLGDFLIGLLSDIFSVGWVLFVVGASTLVFIFFARLSNVKKDFENLNSEARVEPHAQLLQYSSFPYRHMGETRSSTSSGRLDVSVKDENGESTSS